MTGPLVVPLLRLAARRWPAELREEMLAEWWGEVHELARGGRSWPALTFALSLAATRPRVGPFSPMAALVTTGRRTWDGVRLLVVLPAVVVAFGLFAGCLGTASVFSPFAGLIMVAFGIRFVPHGVPVALLIPAVTVPGAVLYLVVDAAMGRRPVALDSHANAAVVFCYVLALTLTVAALLLRAGRPGWAWVAGIAGGFAAADAAYAMRYLGDAFYDPSGAPIWLAAAILQTGFGLPHPDAAEIHALVDDYNADGTVFLALAGFAVGAVLTARVRAPARTAR